jgi:hypothetical protein
MHAKGEHCSLRGFDIRRGVVSGIQAKPQEARPIFAEGSAARTALAIMPCASIALCSSKKRWRL